MYGNLIIDEIQESIDVKKKLLEECKQSIQQAGEIISDAFENDHKAFFCGNGGSAADAQHIAAELLVRYKTENNRRALPAVSMSTDPSYLTATSNDLGYDFIYSRFLEGFAVAGDVLVGISTSGNSKNILKAVEMAKQKNLSIILLLGGTGGALKGLGDAEVIVPSSVTARIQESHILIGHILCSMVERKLFNL